MVAYYTPLAMLPSAVPRPAGLQPVPLRPATGPTGWY